jgi:2-amino-4-hydroxy-6-hydroxymethyldihydropteridine diphosphokinase
VKNTYIALGSNLGDRAENLRLARERMESADLHIVRASSIYETEPRGFRDQPWFLNQVVETHTTLLPRQLLARLLKIEREMGRKRVLPDGPRIIDLDILLHGSALVSTPGLEIPHPRMTARRFVLEPLAELAPDFRHPQTRRTVREMLTEVMDQPVRKL